TACATRRSTGARFGSRDLMVMRIPTSGPCSRRRRGSSAGWLPASSAVMVAHPPGPGRGPTASGYRFAGNGYERELLDQAPDDHVNQGIPRRGLTYPTVRVCRTVACGNAPYIGIYWLTW